MDYVFVYKDIMVGGCELLIEKLGRGLNKSDENNKIIIYYNNIDSVMYERFKNCNFKLLQASSNFYDGLKFENANVITFTLKDYLIFSCNNLRNVKTALYVVHEHIFYFLGNTRNTVIKFIIKMILKKFIINSMRKCNIFFMDEESAKSNMDYFNIKEDVSNVSIVQLPIDEIENDDKILEYRAKNKKNIHILSIARADFPFKGYLLGLVDFIVKNKGRNNINLTIISYGDDIQILEDKIKSLPNEYRECIKLYGKTDYDDLNTFFNNTNLYIGMGTTILDVANRGIISVPVLPYTFSLMGDKFFHESCIYGKGSFNREDMNAENFICMFNRFVNLTEDDYLKLSYVNIDKIKKNYSTNVIIKKIEMNFSKMDFNYINFRKKIILFMYKLKKF